MKKTLSLIACGLTLTGIVGSLIALPNVADAQRGGGRSDAETRWRIRLTGAVLNGRTPQGNGDYRVRASRKGLKVEASNVNLPDGTVLTVTLNDVPIGVITLSLMRGELELRSQDGATPPTVNRGDVVKVLNGASVILRGAF